MASYDEDYVNNYSLEDPINKIVFQVTSCIKNHNDYNSAIKLILDHNLKLEDVVLRTVRLTFKDVVELAKMLILSRS